MAVNLSTGVLKALVASDPRFKDLPEAGQDLIVATYPAGSDWSTHLDNSAAFLASLPPEEVEEVAEEVAITRGTADLTGPGQPDVPARYGVFDPNYDVSNLDALITTPSDPGVSEVEIAEALEDEIDAIIGGYNTNTILDDIAGADSQYGAWVGDSSDMMHTADWVDNDGDGVDDRWQVGPGQPDWRGTDEGINAGYGGGSEVPDDGETPGGGEPDFGIPDLGPGIPWEPPEGDGDAWADGSPVSPEDQWMFDRWGPGPYTPEQIAEWAATQEGQNVLTPEPDDGGDGGGGDGGDGGGDGGDGGDGGGDGGDGGGDGGDGGGDGGDPLDLESIRRRFLNVLAEVGIGADAAGGLWDEFGNRFTDPIFELSDVLLEIYDTDAFKERFPGLAAMRQDAIAAEEDLRGLPSVQDYIQLEQDTMDLLATYGLSYTNLDLHGKDKLIHQLFTNRVTKEDMAHRLAEGKRMMEVVPDELKQTFINWYGPERAEENLMKVFLDPGDEWGGDWMTTQKHIGAATTGYWADIILGLDEEQMMQGGAGQTAAEAIRGLGYSQAQRWELFHELKAEEVLFTEKTGETVDLDMITHGVEGRFGADVSGMSAEQITTMLRQRKEQRIAEFRGGGGAMVTQQGTGLGAAR